MIVINLVLAAIVIVMSLYHVVLGSSAKEEDINIDDIIEELEFKLQRAEIQAEKGDEEAKAKIPLIKNELKKLKKWR